MEPHNKLSNRELFNIGVRLVKFAWVVEILAVSIGFLISIIVSFSVYTQLDKTDRELHFGDYSSILVAALPFVLVAVVEAAKIPVATAMMYAKHRSWRLLFFVGLIMLATITFETMLNGFERNFSGLNIIIDDRKNEALLLQDKVDVLNRRKADIDIIHPMEVDENYQTSIRKANDSYYITLERERAHVNSQIAKLGSEDSVTQQYQAEIAELNKKEREIYDAWDKERDVLQQRLRGLLNSYVSGSEEDRAKLQAELNQLKEEMRVKMEEANFFTRTQVENKYRRLISEKEDRLYTVSDRTIGDDALAKQTQSEQQLQDQLQVLGRDYQKRIDLGRERMAYLEEQILDKVQDIEQKRSAYQNSYARVLQLAGQNRNSTVTRAAQEKDKQLSQYDEIQVEVKAIDDDIYEIQQQQSLIRHDINRLVNSNQIYRLAAYISDKDQAIEVPKSMVGLVALIWFSSLAFISAVTGVFLAIAGIYMQRIYAKDDEYNLVPKEPS
ncbi:hypothetical protein [Marinomonas pollencensis]|uniref:Uncharacterized protein n=1 Tax=Marinomonas pollencensis TaxID=491954 RepID=A0A3E0DBH9_9GAMM|nr:hypothetical protein [Marinomonas pollencensis]REG79342.1 hypothetical protein DFP81_1203 [Marinomonas pollencensis]